MTWRCSLCILLIVLSSALLSATMGSGGRAMLRHAPQFKRDFFLSSLKEYTHQDIRPHINVLCADTWGVTKRMHTWQRVAQNFADTIEHSLQEPHQKKPRRHTTRVLLDNHNIANQKKWQLVSATGFMVYDPLQPKKRRCIQNPELTICYKSGYFCVNGHIFQSKSIHVVSLQGYITFDARTYEGDFTFVRHKDSIFCINSLDLEAYVCSVVYTESWPGWPIEVNKAFAIMARSYAMAQAYQAQKNKRLYHVKNTNAHQTYKGMHQSQAIRQSVTETEGIILTHNKKPILAMFDCCCGGVIPMHMQDCVDFAKAPYLARSYACFYCKECKIYSWNIEYDLAMFERCIKNKIPTCLRLKDAKVIKKDKAGIVQEVLVRSARGIHALSGKQLYSLLPEVKSFCFDVACANNKVIISGKGYGHHCGLCQWGAREMVRQGFNYQQVLSFYYPGTSFTRMI